MLDKIRTLLLQYRTPLALSVGSLAVVALAFVLWRHFTGRTPSPPPSDAADTLAVAPSRTLVVYFSATGTTRPIAQTIATQLQADLFELVPQELYSSDDLNWRDPHSRVSWERDNSTHRRIALQNARPDHFDQYQTIVIGYPIWYGTYSWVIDEFLRTNDFTGKLIYPFATSGSSGIDDSVTDLRAVLSSGQVQAGRRFASDASSQDIAAWTARIYTALRPAQLPEPDDVRVLDSNYIAPPVATPSPTPAATNSARPLL